MKNYDCLYIKKELHGDNDNFKFQKLKLKPWYEENRILYEQLFYAKAEGLKCRFKFSDTEKFEASVLDFDRESVILEMNSFRELYTLKNLESISLPHNIDTSWISYLWTIDEQK